MYRNLIAKMSMTLLSGIFLVSLPSHALVAEEQVRYIQTSAGLNPNASHIGSQPTANPGYNVYNPGYNQGSSPVYNPGYSGNSGYNTNASYTGYNAGYNSGTNPGYSTVYTGNSGYNNGYNAGYNNGYNGYNGLRGNIGGDRGYYSDQGRGYNNYTAPYVYDYSSAYQYEYPYNYPSYTNGYNSDNGPGTAGVYFQLGR